MGTSKQLGTGDEEDVWEPVQMNGKQLENRYVFFIVYSPLWSFIFVYLFCLPLPSPQTHNENNSIKLSEYVCGMHHLLHILIWVDFEELNILIS